MQVGARRERLCLTHADRSLDAKQVLVRRGMVWARAVAKVGRARPTPFPIHVCRKATIATQLWT